MARPGPGRTGTAGHPLVHVGDRLTAAERQRPTSESTSAFGNRRLRARCEADFRESVERITGRKVSAFTSGTDTERDVSSEV